MSKHEFNADVNQLIQLVTHSIYSNKEIFLRELISNANDALAKAKIQSLQDTNYLGDDHKLQITVDIDEKENIITIKDNGIGMDKDEVIENIGTIAKSGTKKFLESIKKNTQEENNLIGQFGIGFYSAFMVADKIELETKKQKGKATTRISDGKGSYEIKESKKKTRGTEIRLFMKDDAKEFANTTRIQSLIKKHSNYIPFPIMVPETQQGDNKGEKKKKDEYKQANKAQSLRTKQKSSIKEEEYQEFYQTISFDSQKPLDYIHLHIEGNINFKALLYIPENTNPFSNMMPEQDYGPQLYVQNVLIMEQSKELLPQRLRFVKGVVETPDLPLNVSREILQNNAVLSKIRTTLIKKILETLSYQLKEKRENYKVFFKNYGKILKEGIHFDRANKEKIAEICLFYSYKKKQNITVDQYIQENKTQSIYYLTGTSIEELEQSPYLEQFSDSKHDVLLLHEPIDERIVQSLQKYKEKELKSAQHATIKNPKQEKSKKKTKKHTKAEKDFLSFLKETIGEEKIDQIDFSEKLTDSVAVLIDKEGQASIQMEKYMQAMGQQVPQSKRDFQINQDHQLTQKAMKLYQKDPNSKKFEQIAHYLYEQALLQQGANVPNMQAFIKRVNTLLQDK